MVFKPIYNWGAHPVGAVYFHRDSINSLKSCPSKIMWLRIFVVNEPLLLWGHLLEELDPHDMLMPSANRCTKYMTYPPLPSGSSTGKSPTSSHWLL